MRASRWVLAVFPLLVAFAGAAWAGHIDWDAWYDGDVRTSVRVGHGDGGVYARGEPVHIELQTDADAYHLVYAIDTRGNVRLLYPRFWVADGWLPAGCRIVLRDDDLAWPTHRWQGDGIVFVEVVASPDPFDWHRIGLVRRGSGCEWLSGGRPLRVSGDPFLAFNDLHRSMFHPWQNALFSVDYTWFYVGQRCDAPLYLRSHVGRPGRDIEIELRLGWRWEFGPWCARPVYRKAYSRLQRKWIAPTPRRASAPRSRPEPRYVADVYGNAPVDTGKRPRVGVHRTRTDAAVRSKEDSQAKRQRHRQRRRAGER